MPECVTCFQERDEGMTHQHGEFKKHFHCCVCIAEDRREFNEQTKYLRSGFKHLLKGIFSELDEQRRTWAFNEVAKNLQELAKALLKTTPIEKEKENQN